MIFTEACFIPRTGDPAAWTSGKTGSVRRCFPGYLYLLVILE